MEKEMLRGSLELLILSRIQSNDTYGGKILKDILHDSHQTLSVSEGTLYSLLKRLEKRNWIQSYWGEEQVGARRKYYQITPKGKEIYQRKLQDWRLLNQLIEQGV
ncbi:PadR family transcriptional regulator [Enterococcus olivae]